VAKVRQRQLKDPTSPLDPTFREMICVALLAALGLAVAAPIHYTVADEVFAKHDETCCRCRRRVLTAPPSTR